MNDPLHVLPVRLGETLHQNGKLLTLAESCTGGWIAKVLTDVSGSSGWFDRGFVTYSNESKQEMLGVEEEILRMHGAVSEPVVRAMALGALEQSRADLSVAVSGIAGPGGGTDEKPVGTVWFAWAEQNGEVFAQRNQFDGDRESVRLQAVIAALAGLFDLVSDNNNGNTE